ncbi:MAG: proteasome accessory factor PafA2 [Actinobacteria bacterium]|nr:proteasome accessory factor PafA2 [Actinomycetota bacterium]
MAVHKYLGLETEFGIAHRGVSDPDPILASSLLINGYLRSISLDGDGDPARIEWDFEGETPGNDARDAPQPASRPPVVERHLVNTVLRNGARYYVDHAHPELSTPECADARSIVVWDRAAAVIVQRSMEAARSLLGPDEELVVYKNNSDGKGNSYGCHENYLVDRSVPFHRIVDVGTMHFVTRQIYTGSGKVGSEIPGVDVPYQITQRADFFEAEVGLETTLKRPIINTRDEPHADAARFRRLHVICGDANCSEVATLLKVGTTALILAMLEDGVALPDIRFAAPVAAMRSVSTDLSLRGGLRCVDGRSVTALDVQFELLELAVSHVAAGGAEAIGGDDVARLILGHWRTVLEGLESDPDRLADRLDWVAKRRLIDAYRERHDLGWSDPRLSAIALQYHDLRPDRSLAGRAGLLRICDDDEVARAVDTPPEDTRAWFRGTCLRRYPDAVVSANWDSLVFDVGEPPLRRVPMLDPGRGTRIQIGTLVERSATAAELLANLAS